MVFESPLAFREFSGKADEAREAKSGRRKDVKALGS
jgi:hypothetical protein